VGAVLVVTSRQRVVPKLLRSLYLPNINKTNNSNNKNNNSSINNIIITKATLSSSPSLKNTRTTVTVTTSPNASMNYTSIQKQKTHSVASSNSGSDSLSSSSSKIANMTKSHTNQKNLLLNYTSADAIQISSSAYFDERLSDLSKPPRVPNITHTTPVTSPSRTFHPWNDNTSPIRPSYSKSAVSMRPKPTVTQNSFSIEQLTASSQSSAMNTPQKGDERTLFQTTPTISPYAVTPTLVRKSPSKSIDLESTPAQLSKQIKRKSLQEEEDFAKNKRQFLSHQSPLNTAQSPTERHWSPSPNEHVNIPRNSSSAARTVVSHSNAERDVSNHSIQSQLNSWASPRHDNNSLTSPEKIQHLSHRSFSHVVQKQISPVAQHHNYASTHTPTGSDLTFHHSTHHQEGHSRGNLVQQQQHQQHQQQQQQRQKLSHYQHTQNHHHHHHHQANGASSFDHR